ncbi:MAG TPA: DUF1697 domain-containing protein [Rhizomicrobium sp.]
MAIQIALLRAVNVGGTSILPMADLRAAVEKAGFKNVRTLLQSGNLVFDAGSQSAAATQKTLQTLCAKAFDLNTEILVRTPQDLDAIIAANPFAPEAKAEPGHVHVLFLRESPPPAAYATLQAAIRGNECVKGGGRHAYMLYPDGMGRSKLTSAVLARYLGMPGTARNWNTVLKLAALSAGQ